MQGRLLGKASGKVLSDIKGPMKGTLGLWVTVTLSPCRLCERDPYQLYQRLEQQAREYVLEMKVRLLRQLSAVSRVKVPAALQGPPQAHQFVSLLLEEYGALCQAARAISTFLGTLVRQRPPVFRWEWRTVWWGDTPSAPSRSGPGGRTEPTPLSLSAAGQKC